MADYTSNQISIIVISTSLMCYAVHSVSLQSFLPQIILSYILVLSAPRGTDGSFQPAPSITIVLFVSNHTSMPSRTIVFY